MDSTGDAQDEDALSDGQQANPFRFEGHYYDAAFKTYDMKARAYLPEVGRFLQEDHYEAALGDQALETDPLTQDRYAFAGGNPTNNIEFDGHKSCTATCRPQENQQNYGGEVRKIPGERDPQAKHFTGAHQPIGPREEAAATADPVRVSACGKGGCMTALLPATGRGDDALAPLKGLWQGIDDFGGTAGAEVIGGIGSTIETIDRCNRFTGDPHSAYCDEAFSIPASAELVRHCDRDGFLKATGCGVGVALGMVGFKGRGAAKAVRPSVSDARLGRALGDDYRGGPNPIGDGSALDAARHTARTGDLVGGSTHLEKAMEMRNRYGRILGRGGLSAADEAVARGRFEAYRGFAREHRLDEMMRARGLR